MIETLTFRLARGVDEGLFLEADQRVQIGFYHQRTGFLRRTTARGVEGEWIVVVLWDSEADAAAAGKLAEDDVASSEFMSLVEVSGVKRYTALD